MKNKRGENYSKVVVFTIFLVIISLLVIELVSSENLISNGNVKYESNSLDVFNNKTLAEEKMIHNATNYQTLKIIDDEVWLKVIVRLKDKSEIKISGNRIEKIGLIKQKEEWFEPRIDEVLSKFSNEDVRKVHKLSNGFGALVSKKGFEKLIDNGVVESVNWPKRGAVALLEESAPLINANDAWNILGYTGDNIDVCVIDTGVDTDHSDFVGKIVGKFFYFRGEIN